jgi:uncharacterized membrane protein
MAPDPEPQLSRWIEAGLIDPAAAAAIRRWEATQAPRSRLALPIRLALAIGALLLAAGLLLFVSAHWEVLGPGQRFALLLGLVVALPVATCIQTAAYRQLFGGRSQGPLNSD